MVPAIKKISDNICRCYPIHCVNGRLQVKGIGFNQYYYPVLSQTTLWLIVFIDATYHLTIGIADFTNAIQNILKASSEK